MDYYQALEVMCRPVRAVDFPRALEPMQRLLDVLGNPEREFPAVVVAGSVGKGSACAAIAAALRTVPGLRVGLFTGPHLHSFRERFVLDGRMITPGIFVALTQEVQQAAERLNFPYSTFERSTALALLWFKRAGAKVMVLEAGIGGRFDAVNTVPKAAAVITPLELEHVAMLGGSLQSIAQHKAGIIERGGCAFSVPQPDEAADVLRHEAEQQGAALHFVEPEQLASAVCGWMAEQGWIPAQPTAYPVPALAARVETVRVGGRDLTIDGGHTPLAAARLWAHLAAQREAEAEGAARLVVGMLKDKASAAYLQAFDHAGVQLVLTQAPGHRGLPAAELAALADLQAAQVTVQPDLAAALNGLASAPESARAVAGSLRMAAAAREHYGLLLPDALEESQRTRALFEGDAYLKRLLPS
jgi:dihydrofolate synthase/folylpolyglutamate synthase